MNYFGSHPKILYLPATGICLLIMYWTHIYVQNRLKDAISPKNTPATTAPATPPPPQNTTYGPKSPIMPNNKGNVDIH